MNWNASPLFSKLLLPLSQVGGSDFGVVWGMGEFGGGGGRGAHGIGWNGVGGF